MIKCTLTLETYSNSAPFHIRVSRVTFSELTITCTQLELEPSSFDSGHWFGSSFTFHVYVSQAKVMFFELAIVCSLWFSLIFLHLPIQVSKVTFSFSIMFLLVFIFHNNTNSLYPIQLV